MNIDAVRDCYAGFGECEWMRLENPADGALEFAITCHMLDTYPICRPMRGYSTSAAGRGAMPFGWPAGVIASSWLTSPLK